MTENIVTGKKYRVLTDAENDQWDRISFWTKASDIEFEDGKNLEEKMIDLTAQMQEFILGYKIIDETYQYNGSMQQMIVPQTGFYKITLVGGSHLGYQQDFYVGTNAGSIKHTESSLGGLITATYLLKRNDVIGIEPGNCIPKTTTSIKCNGDTGSIITSTMPSGTAGSSKLYINDTLYMTANGGSISNVSSSVQRVTDGTAGSSGANPKYVCTGYTGTIYGGGSGDYLSDDFYKAYDVTVLTRSNQNMEGYKGYCTIKSTNRPSVGE